MLTLQEKKDKLRRIPSEVPDLHDWLQVLLEKMPNVVYVEYTHGRNEFGADFVLEVANSTTGRNEFIGVIVKRGTIKQDTSEVDRQIRECGIPRIIKNGRDEQSLPIVWVVSNEGTTSNAEKKIRHEYRQHAISFFGMEDIIRWTDAYAPHLWDDLPSKIGKYLQDVRYRLEELDKKSSLLGDHVSDIRLELDLTAVDTDTYRKPSRKPEHVDLYDEVKLRRVVFLEGDMGAGKSQLLRSLGQQLCSSKNFNQSKLLPVFSTYRNLIDKRGGSLEALLTAETGELLGQIQAGEITAIFLIDGLDEVPSPCTDGASLRDLVDQVRGLKNTKAAFSCRSGVVPVATINSTADLRHLEVRPLTIKKMTTFIAAVCERVKRSNRVARDLGKSELFRQLPQNPIAALLLTRLVLQSPEHDELPQTLTGLYEKALELMLGRWDLEKGLCSQQEYDVSRRLCGEIAQLMVANKIGAIGMNEVEARLREYLTARNLTVDPSVLLERLFSRSGVFANDDANGTVFFRHRSFAEFFFAEEWLRSNKFEVDNRALDPYWATIYFFAIGKLSDCEEVLKEVLALQPMSDDQRLGKVMATPMYLLAGHMTPYSIVESNLPALLIDAAKLQVDVLAGRHDSALRSLTPIALLFVMQFLLRDKYGYQFFRRAIDGAAIAISDAIEDDAVKAYALFYLGAIGVDLDHPEAMQFLIDKYEPRELPLAVAVAAAAEIERDKRRSGIAVLKAFNKRVQKMLKSNPSLKAALSGIMTRPISDLTQARNSTLERRRSAKQSGAH